jgi:NitT/TauT family transport system permease protein
MGLYNCGSFLSHTAVSLLRALIGFLLGAVAGVSLGLVMGAGRAARGLLEPLVELLRPLCPIAWLPFAIAVFKMKTLPELFGFSRTGTVFDQIQQGMVFVLFFGAVIPILTNTVDGVSGVRQTYLRLARTLGASRLQIFLHVYLPAALPTILTGLRQGIGTCWMVIIAAEMLPGSDSGIGYLLMYAADKCDMDVVVTAMLTIAVTGAALNFAMLWMMRHWAGWHGKET